MNYGERTHTASLSWSKELDKGHALCRRFSPGQRLVALHTAINPPVSPSERIIVQSLSIPLTVRSQRPEGLIQLKCR